MRNPLVQDKLATLENQIARALQPVQPKQEFVQHVRRRIHLAPMPVVAQRLKTTPNQLLLAIGGIVTATLLIITGTRALFYLLGRIK